MLPQELTRHEAEYRLRCLIDPRGHFLAKAVLLAGLAYPFTPIDIIPNRLPIIGYADQVGFVVGGVVLAYLLPRGSAPASSEPPLRDTLRRRARTLGLSLFAWVLALPLLRMAIGRNPDHAEIAAFRCAFTRFAPMPPLIRALARVPAARPFLMRAMLANWLLADEAYRGDLRRELGSSTATGDALRIWSGPPVSFLHLEKTAGMSVLSVLAAQFHPLQIDADIRREFPPHVLSPLPQFLVPRVRRCKLAFGHYDLPSLRRLGPGRFTFTLLRCPRERILSLYDYWRAQAALDLGWNGMNQAVLAAQRASLTEFLTTDNPFVINYIDNLYVRRLTGQYAFGNRDPLAEDPEYWLAQAQQALASLDYVGLTENMASSLAHLSARLGFDPPAAMPRVNITASNRRRAVPDPIGEAALARLTRLDDELYKAVALRHAE